MVPPVPADAVMIGSWAVKAAPTLVLPFMVTVQVLARAGAGSGPSGKARACTGGRREGHGRPRGERGAARVRGDRTRPCPGFRHGEGIGSCAEARRDRMVPRDVTERVGSDRAHRGAIYRDACDRIPRGRCDAERLACPVVHRNGACRGYGTARAR